MNIFILNILGALFGALAAILGFSSNKKWENGWFTKEGYVLAGCVLLIALSQISVQIIQNKHTIAIQKVVNEAYSGWIKVGSLKKR